MRCESQENTKMLDEEGDVLTRAFRSAGREFGYDDIEAQFTPFRDFKMRWSRSYKWIKFDVSDYVREAPESILESLARTVFTKISGAEDSGYSEDASEWITSEAFVRRNQPLYIRRNRGLSLSTAGTHRDLADSYERLIAKGYVSRDPLLYIGWGHPGTGRHAGFCSVLMRVVSISPVLDDAGIPENVLDYCLYAQLAHISMGFDPQFRRRSEQYDELLNKYEGRRAAEDYMERMSIKM